ncbi:VPA1262 family N-terminal domain-containing protein [Acidiphilium sp.]|uniref:VPA1262 family N-terminal domain-containing protein n=1 Tax=Acidiphilium sp. TaxID=527 RepID=UPI002BA67F75|nr:VPA1262 family N-terminal domain-containing protein [Acidiphilium sp.]HQT62431.1 VPA1262 family N-terminal domain-containing protein [Acidiphilium sp.]
MLEEPLVANDYRYAVVQCIALLYEEKFHLVFASAELLPAELPRPPDEPEAASDPARRLNSRARLFHRRYVVTAAEARAWYDECRQGTFKLLADDSARETEHAPLFQEPAWPQLITGAKFPVWGDTPSSTRVHHLYPAATPPLLVKLFQLHPELEKWVSDRIFASVLRYPELAGSIHLLVPNPLYRDLKVRLNVAQDGTESIVVEISPRAGKSSENLEVLVLEHRPSGVSSLQVQRFGARPYMAVPFQSTVQETEIFIHCRQRGLLEWQPPSSFIRGFSINGGIVSARKTVVVPQPDGQPGQPYKVNVVEQGWTSKHTSNAASTEIPARLRASARERLRNDEAERLGQKWFHRSREEATEFVRDLVGKARERVWIVDPYFATVELFSFALATTRSDVEVKILTSALALTDVDTINPSAEAGDVLLNNIHNRPEMAGISVLVMTGETPTVHDRFLGRLWRLRSRDDGGLRRLRSGHDGRLRWLWRFRSGDDGWLRRLRPRHDGRLRRLRRMGRESPAQ